MICLNWQPEHFQRTLFDARDSIERGIGAEVIGQTYIAAHMVRSRMLYDIRYIAGARIALSYRYALGRSHDHHAHVIGRLFILCLLYTSPR